MFLRRAVYYWQLIAALLLPLWLFVGWGIWGGGAWTFVGVVVAAPVLFIAILVVTLIIYGRSEVRAANAVSWLDVALLALWHLSIIGLGCFGATGSLFAMLTVVTGLAAFWGTLWQLVRGFTRRARQTLREFEQLAGQTPPRGHVSSPEQGDVYVVYESRDQRRA
ncbi:hypothetical protein SAMN04489806_3262 [Paramicrobacterium humi]|uniref:MFS transporter permease n=1 Tax=Paramicrobacterium humi TaxID=640635 RepID=A0A1H4TMW6_9MICO|nr:hypothetical protein [Microbacterium humi]SEC57812.1 hypothetical protein SAMN04489806_3262 [Microbacterium humi]